MLGVLYMPPLHHAPHSTLNWPKLVLVRILTRFSLSHVKNIRRMYKHVLVCVTCAFFDDVSSPVTVWCEAAEPDRVQFCHPRIRYFCRCVATFVLNSYKLVYSMAVIEPVGISLLLPLLGYRTSVGLPKIKSRSEQGARAPFLVLQKLSRLV